MPKYTIPVAAFQDLTLTDNFDDTETATIAGKAYTMQTTLTNVDGNVQLASGGTAAEDAEATLNNLADAINLDSGFSGAGGGTSYAALMTENAHVVATRPSALVLRVTAKVPGTIGNFIPVSETHGEGAWGSTVLASGTGSVVDVFETLKSAAQVNAEVEQLLRRIDGDPANA